jgi:hypothetical protein
MHRFVMGVLHRPIAYAQSVRDQVQTYFRLSFVEFYEGTSVSQAGVDRDQGLLKQYSSRIGVGPGGFATSVTNPIPEGFPGIADYVRYQVTSKAADVFWVVAALAAALAVIFMFAVPGRERKDTEIVVVCVAGFISSWILTVAMSHSFDVLRYDMALIPFALLWSGVSMIYLLYAVIVRIPAVFRKMDRADAAKNGGLGIR